MRRDISSVRPDCLPREDSRGVRCSVARGNMPYSPVTQPLPEPFMNCGTPSVTDAVQITRVRPTSMSTLPSAVGTKSGVIFTARIWSGARPSVRNASPLKASSTIVFNFYCNFDFNFDYGASVRGTRRGVNRWLGRDRWRGGQRGDLEKSREVDVACERV